MFLLPFCRRTQHIYLDYSTAPTQFQHAKMSVPSLFGKEKRNCISTVPFVLALPIFPGRLQPSIVGRNELNYRVRNGNGWTLILISTNSLSIGFSSEEQTVL